MTEFLNSLQGTSVSDWKVVLVSILTAFFLCHLVAAAYAMSYRGLSYSRSFVQTLVMGGVVAAMLMLAIGNNLVWGIGIVGTLAIIRFRTNLRDPRDMVFIFAALAAGIAAGVNAYAVAVIGTMAFCLVSLYLNLVPFGARNHFDGLLSFTLPVIDDKSRHEVEGIFRAHCAKCVLASLQQAAQGDEAEHAYQIRFRGKASRFLLLKELENVRGLRSLSLLMQETQVDL
jgi:uncharacterized membrane protein YhiD involved in acid resistance